MIIILLLSLYLEYVFQRLNQVNTPLDKFIIKIYLKNMENKKEEPTLNKVTFVNGVQIKNKSGKH